VGKAMRTHGKFYVSFEKEKAFDDLRGGRLEKYLPDE